MTVLSWAFILLTAAAGVMRTAVELSMVEASTGFYTSGGGLVTAQNLAYLAAAAVPAILLWRSPRGCAVHFWARGRILGGLLCAAGAVLGISSIVSLFMDPPAAFTGGTALSSFMLPAAQVTGAAAAAALIFTGWNLILSGKYRCGLWFGGVCALWMTVDGIARFMAYPTIANISDQKLEVVALCMGALFWLSSARLVSGRELGASPRGAKLWALLFCLFALTTGVPQMIAALLGAGSPVHMGFPRQAVLILLGVYAAVWSGSVRLQKEGVSEAAQGGGNA